MTRNVLPLVAIVLALATGAAATAAIASWSTGPFGPSEALDSRSFRILNEGATPAKIAEAKSLLSTAAGLSPYNNAARLRRVVIDTAVSGRLSPENAKAIEQSYDLLPVDHTVAEWRIAFCLEHWGELTPETRLAVRYEVLALASLREARWDMGKILQSVQDSRGRLAAMLLLQEIR